MNNCLTIYVFDFGWNEMFFCSKITIGGKVLWRFVEVVGGSWGSISCCWILDSPNFGYYGQLNWNGMDFLHSIVGILRWFHSCWLGIQNLNQLLLMSKNWSNDPCFGCEAFVVDSFWQLCRPWNK